jgi:transcriptional regulator with XRE-family HTH domain
MSDVAHILGEFIAAWNAGRRPRMASYLERVPPADREELADQIETFLMVAPEPEYDEATWAEMTSDPMISRAAVASMEAADPQPLPVLRARAGLSVAQLAERLGFTGARRTKAERYLAEVESGVLAPRRPLLERLARALGVPAEAIVERAVPDAPAAAAVFRRAAEAPHDARLDVVADALLSDDEEWDEVDELFLGGRE